MSELEQTTAYNIIDEVKKQYHFHNRYVIAKDLQRVYHIVTDEPYANQFTEETWLAYCKGKFNRGNVV